MNSRKKKKYKKIYLTLTSSCTAWKGQKWASILCLLSIVSFSFFCHSGWQLTANCHITDFVGFVKKEKPGFKKWTSKPPWGFMKIGIAFSWFSIGKEPSREAFPLSLQLTSMRYIYPICVYKAVCYAKTIQKGKNIFPTVFILRRREKSRV